jgi:energy-coupling factor transporter ATP-binding protein EcfA2
MTAANRPEPDGSKCAESRGSATYGRDLVRCHAGQTRPAVDGLDYDLPTGITAIAGMAAGGMSTLCGLAGGAYLPNSGKVVIDHADITAMTPLAAVTWCEQHVRYLVHVLPMPDGSAGRPVAVACAGADLGYNCRRLALVVAHEPGWWLPADAQTRARNLLRDLARRLPVLVSNDAELQAEAAVIRLPARGHDHKPEHRNVTRLADLGVPVTDEAGIYGLALPSEANGALPGAVPRFVGPTTWRLVRQTYGRAYRLADYGQLRPGTVRDDPRG